jgi:hypothetical protein
VFGEDAPRVLLVVDQQVVRGERAGLGTAVRSAVGWHNGRVHEDEELLEKVRALRVGGSGPKQIARALGLRPAQAGALLRRVAQVDQAAVAPGQRAVIGCWVNAGWSTGLDLSAVPEWAAADRTAGEQAMGAGFAQVLVARQERASRVTVCSVLVDVWCLGAKDVIAPRSMGVGSLETHRRTTYSAFDEPPLAIGLAQAQAIVYGAVAYARELGFEPADGFAEASALLGEPDRELPALGFGKDGLPLYINGPRDDARRVIDTLERTRGAGNYHYFLQSGPM